MGRSVRYALLVALSYGAVATTYILVSSHLAAASSTDVDELRRIETLKGVLFVAVTTLATGVASWLAMRRIDRDANELLQKQRALLAAEGKVFAGVMAASVAHDANNVLVAVLGDLEELAAASDLQGHAQIDRLRRSVQRLVELNRRLVLAVRQGAPRELATADVTAVVHDTVAVLRSHPHLRRCRLVCHAAGAIELATQPLLVHQIVANLVLNAGQATDGRGTVGVAVHDDGDAVRIVVDDDGPGVPADRRAGLFAGLASTKPEGTGLGLFSVRACCESLGGTVEVGDAPAGGACFTVRLPKRAG